MGYHRPVTLAPPAADLAIRVDGLGKLYRIGELQRGYGTLKDVFAGVTGRLRGRPAPSHHAAAAFWALRKVSFEVARGEAVGVVGRNGSGKSTLLKVLSRITPPTEGRAMLAGRTASMLEVGTGFHSELTGRENIFLNGVILGMRRAELERKFDEIVEFAEVDRFIDTPVKHYSSGMYVRLAFSVAATMDPDILLADEVLAVGDIAFQEKCIARMKASAASGRTVMFVSHNPSLLEALCPRSLYMRAGELVMDGPTPEVLDRYRDDLAQG